MKNYTKTVPKTGQSQRKAARKWDKNHLHTISANVPIREWVMFREACRRRGETMHNAIRRLAADYVQEVIPNG